jgi:lipoprotein NlpD
VAFRRPAAARVVPGPGLIRLALLAGAALALAGCAELTRWEPETPGRPAAGSGVAGVHVVQRGETLYKIAFAHRLDWRDLAAWNRLSDAHRIYPGQQIRLSPPAAAPPGAARRPDPPPSPPGRPATPPPASVPAAVPPRAVAGAPPQWRWPATGPMVWRFGESRRNPTGIGIGGADGGEIRAAADGEVVYSGSGLIGYGQLIILKHNDSYLSAYGYNQALRVKEGEAVRSGQVIALMGRGPADRPLLHFEIRVDGKPVDPARFLPPR